MQKTTEGVSVADSLRDARVALRTAWYDTALELLDGCEDWPSEYSEQAIVLKADAIGRRDPVDAVSYLATVEDIPSSPAGRFSFALESGKAHAYVRDFASADARYAEARRLVDAAPYGANTLAYHQLRLQYLRRQCDPAAPEVALALAHPDPSIASNAYAARAWMYAYLGQYAAHVADLRSSVAYATMPGADQLDVGALSAAIHSLAQVAFETADTEGIATAQAAADAIAWTPHVQTKQFLTIRALGWDAFMRGRAGQAQWAFKDARAIAPSVEWRIMSHLDRAYVARMARNEVWAIEELAEADRLAREVRWESNFDEARQVLVMLAVLHAPIDATRAQRYAAMYSQIGTENVNPALAISGDRRAVGHAKYAQGRIDQTLGRRESAVNALTEAYEIFEGASFHYRATLAASALVELTGETGWREKAMAHANRYPDCPLASMVEEAVAREDAMPKELTALQRQIARALWSGAEPAELSKRFSRSLYTIEQQIGVVYGAFGVKSRNGLLEEARSRGLA